MAPTISRRAFLGAGLAGGLAARTGYGGEDRPAPEVCLTICNHWSYIGIGWQLGLESCVLSATDAMEMADRPPHVKTCLNLDARAYEFMAEKFPEVTERLKTYLASGKIELIGGTYGQPMGTTISGESNIRQMTLGLQVIRKALGHEVATFLEEEEFTHPQVPQLATLAGFRYASLAQLDTWGRAGCPRQDANVVLWKGLDGTTLRCVPKNALFGFSPDPKKLAESKEFQKLAGQGKPLIFAWEEFGWEAPEKPAYLTAPARYQALSRVEFVTLKEYLDKYGKQAEGPVYLPMDAWNKSLTWGLGGDQVRILDRQVEGLLLAAEMFDAVAASLGRPSRAQDLEKAWRDLLAAQSHDVGLCEYSRWQGDRMAPLDRIEDKHNFTWGAIGYNHLDQAQKQGQEILDGALTFLAGRVKGGPAGKGERTATVFNALGWSRSDLARTGRVYPVPAGCTAVTVRDRSGKVLPTQPIRETRNPAGGLVVTELAFPARDTPPGGYDTYTLEFAATTAPPVPTSLVIDAGALGLENEFVKVRLDPTTGGLASLVEKSSGKEALSPGQDVFPHFTGRPNPNLSTRPNPPPLYDSGKSRAEITWHARGPLWATVGARHTWPYCQFETRVTLAAGQPHVEVLTRVLAQLPPHSDAAPADIKEGYWASLRPGFPVKRVLRDFPFGVEETKNGAFHALTFVDLLGDDMGLLVLHPGTQYFRRESSGALSNLLMREWESHFTREYGWPVYAEYRHALLPHRGPLTHGERHRAAAAFTLPLLCVVGAPGTGDQPPARGFAGLSTPGVQLSAFRRKTEGGYEVRVVETEGQRTNATLHLGLSARKAVLTDLAGRKLEDAVLKDGQLTLALGPWKIGTFHIE